MEFAVQARLIERRGDVIVRDETRLGSATFLDDAVGTARAHAADGFTVWIYEVRRADSGPPTYRMVDTLRPDPQPSTGPSARRPGTATHRSAGLS